MRFRSVFLFVLLSGVGTAAADPPVAETARVSNGPSALIIQALDPKGNLIADTEMQEWWALVGALKLRGTVAEGISLQEHQAGGRVYSLFESGDECMVLDRSMFEPAPNVTFSGPTPEGISVSVRAANSTCWGCSIFYQRYIDLEEEECSMVCPTCACMHCIVKPCPLPPPPPPRNCDGWWDPDGEPCPWADDQEIPILNFGD